MSLIPFSFCWWFIFFERSFFRLRAGGWLLILFFFFWYRYENERERSIPSDRYPYPFRVPVSCHIHSEPLPAFVPGVPYEILVLIL